MLTSLSISLTWILILLPCSVLAFLVDIQHSSFGLRSRLNPVGDTKYSNSFVREQYTASSQYNSVRSSKSSLYALPPQEIGELFSSLLANIDVSGVTPNEDATALVSSVSAPSAIFGNVIPGLSAGQAASLDSFLAEVLLGLGAFGLGYYAIEDELPIGMAREDLLYADESSLGPGVGMGLFARENLPKDTVIGIYPGKRYKDKDVWVNSKRSTEAAVLAMSYIWSCEDGTIIDPTNVDGILPVRLQVLGGLFPSISTYMSLINEPGVGQDVNVVFEENPERKGKGEVIVRAERDIYAGEELFTDYGPIYNRSNYYK